MRIGQFSLNQEAEMKSLGAVAVCVAVLYVVDATWFDGWYFAVVSQMVATFYAQWM
jgi:hypothetical protein